MAGRYWRGNKKIEVSELFHELSDKDIENLRDDYLNRSTYKMTDLFEKYHLDPSIFENGVLRKTLPPIKSEQKCPYCKEEMYYDVPSRSALHFPKPDLFYCVKCGHKRKYNSYLETISDKDCNCQNCIAAREQEKIRKKEIVLSKYSYQAEPKSLSEINVKDRADLLWLLDYSDYQNFYSFSFDYIGKKRDEMAVEVVRELYRNRILFVNPESDVNCFYWDNNCQADRFYTKIR